MRKLQQLVVDWLVYVTVRALLATIQTLSLDCGDRIAAGGGWVLARLPLRRRIIDENLQRVFVGMTPAERLRYREAMWHHLLLMVCELAWVPRRIHRTNWKEHGRITNMPAILGPMLGARPSLTVTGHFGNFEVGGYLTGLFGLRTMTIARPLDNRFLHRFITQHRGAKGQVMVPKDGSAPIVDAHLKAGKALALLADQHAGERGCWVDFLGVPASCHKSLALFTLIAGAPLVVVSNRRDGRPLQFVMDFFGTADPEVPGAHLAGVKELTIWYNQKLAQAIAMAPEQYWWLHRRWRKMPEKPAKTAKSVAA